MQFDLPRAADLLEAVAKVLVDLAHHALELRQPLLLQPLMQGLGDEGQGCDAYDKYIIILD